jgi:HCOMODA/2-hydroxy-3-carboxy-muconic semialdehyde decarboxylase
MAAIKSSITMPHRRDFLRAALAGLAAFPAFAQAESLIADIVVGNHILYDQGIVDAFGHLSARDPRNPNRYWLARNMAPSLVSEKDVLQYDLDSNQINPQPGDRSYLERFIHGEIYRARPDVMAVVHDHSAAVIPFGVSNAPLRPVYHMGSFLGDVRRWEIRDASKQPTNMLVSDGALGQSLAKALGPAPVVLMRGHGVTVVGASIKEVVFRSIYTEINARVQAQAMGLGGSVEYLTKEEAALSAQANAGQYDRAWDLWKRRVAN